MKLKCLVVEDEPLAQEIISGYIRDCGQLEVVKICQDALEALDLLRQESIDLIFLDINLPRLSGLNFLKILDSRPMIIFTTAYPEYAVDGFEADAVDYLVKPFSFERFLKAVNKALEKKHISRHPAENLHPSSGALQDFILLRADKKLYKIPLAEIHTIEATGDYLKVFYADKYLVVHETISGILEKLPSDNFLRVHKSFIISINQINYLEGNRIRIGSAFIPIGRSYKEEVGRRLRKGCPLDPIGCQMPDAGCRMPPLSGICNSAPDSFNSSPNK